MHETVNKVSLQTFVFNTCLAGPDTVWRIYFTSQMFLMVLSSCGVEFYGAFWAKTGRQAKGQTLLGLKRLKQKLR